jgi:hypothetical protein
MRGIFHGDIQSTYPVPFKRSMAFNASLSSGKSVKKFFLVGTSA